MITRRFSFLPMAASLLGLSAFTSAFSQGTPAVKKIAIIKADDVKSNNAKWDRFIKVSQERGVKVSIGLIGNSLEKPNEAYHQWLKDWTKTGQVEFWHHGWDHKSWEAEGKKLSEFGGSGYDHQRSHLDKTQAAIKTATGAPFVTFGSPFNAMDADTAKALNELPELRLIFAYSGNPAVKQLKDKTILPMVLRGEHDGTGKPNFTKFKEDYAKKIAGPAIPVTAVQFHPMGFSEEGFKHYTDILDLLLADGWTFMLPIEYEKWSNQIK